MKTEIKIAIAAIVVIIIVLAGAFALGGSGGSQPTAMPAAQSTNIPTPTPAPTGTGSIGGVSNPSHMPSVTPTATPAPIATPTPMPESGVKLTEFGYWITYPPLGPEKWSTNPPPKINGSLAPPLPLVSFEETHYTYTYTYDHTIEGWTIAIPVVSNVITTEPYQVTVTDDGNAPSSIQLLKNVNMPAGTNTGYMYIVFHYDESFSPSGDIPITYRIVQNTPATYDLGNISATTLHYHFTIDS